MKTETKTSKPEPREGVRAWGEYLNQFSDLGPFKLARAREAKRGERTMARLSQRSDPLAARRTVCPAPAARLKAKADTAARAARPRVSRWVRASATVEPLEHGIIREDAVKKRGWKYASTDHTPFYFSRATIAKGGACLLHEFIADGFRQARIVRAPSGCKWAHDELGLLLVRADGMEYHPTAAEFEAKNFCAVAAAALAYNWKIRRASERMTRDMAAQEKRNAKAAAVAEAALLVRLNSCRVTLDDSRRAGNCIEGALRFAEAKLRIARDEIIAGGFLFSVSAKKLWATGDARAKAACVSALQREELVSI